MEKHWKFPLHIEIAAYDLTVCREIDLGSLCKFKVIAKKMHNFSCLSHILYIVMKKCLEADFDTKIALDLLTCLDLKLCRLFVKV